MATTAAALPLLLTTATMWAQQWMRAAAADCPEFYRRKNPQHTACKPLNSWCKIKESGVDDIQRSLILKLHNDYRSRIARGNVTGFKPAADMQELLWDSDLEYVAQAHANLCTTPDGDLKHDDVRDRFTPRFEFTGQNLAWIGRSFGNGGPNWTYVILGWFAEYRLYPAGLVSRLEVTPGVKTGHFTQLAWAKSRYVGCGYVYYTVDKARYPHMKHYTCDYGPSGNYLRQPVYQEGATCSACPEPTQCNRRKGLCDGTSNDPGETNPFIRYRAPVPIPNASPSQPRTEPPTTLEPMTESPYVQDFYPKPLPIPESDDPYSTIQPSTDTVKFPPVGVGGGSQDAQGDENAYRHVDEEGSGWLSFIAVCVSGVAIAALATFFVFWRYMAATPLPEPGGATGARSLTTSALP